MTATLQEPPLATPPTDRARDAWIGRRVAWHVLPEWRDVLLEGGELRLSHWLARGEAVIVKHGTHRTVYRVETCGRSFYVKHYRSAHVLDAARHWFRPTAARREFDHARRLAQCGVPAICPIAWGQWRTPLGVWDHFLITEAVTGTMSLAGLAERLAAPDERGGRLSLAGRLAVGLARLCAACHRAGVVHDDLHSGNVLVRCDDLEDEHTVPELLLVDVPNLRWRSPLDWPASRASLVMVCADWWERAAPVLRWRFWRAYRRARPELPLADAKVAAGQIITRARDYACGVMLGRDKRCWRNNRDYHALATPRARAHALVAVDAASLRNFADEPAALLRAGVERPHKLSHSTVVVESVMDVGGQPTPVIVKRFRVKEPFKRGLAAWRTPRAFVAWQRGQALFERGIATARPLAVCVTRAGARRGEGYLVVERLADASNLHEYAWSLAKLGRDDRRRRTWEVAESLGRTLGRMHAWRVAHRDLKACNLLIASFDGVPRAHVLDMDGVRLRRHLSAAERARDLARLAASVLIHDGVTRADRWRFLRAYAHEMQPEVLDLKALWRAIVRRMAAIVARHGRCGKPLT